MNAVRGRWRSGRLHWEVDRNEVLRSALDRQSHSRGLKHNADGIVISTKMMRVLDNDKAGRDVVSYARGIAKNQGLPLIAGLEYVFVRPNLYVIRIPSPAEEKDFVIEHLFSARLLSTKLGGKTLSLSNKGVGEHEYGKMYFAKHVVPHAEPDDFLGFKPLLGTLVEVLADFASRVRAAPTATKV